MAQQSIVGSNTDSASLAGFFLKRPNVSRPNNVSPRDISVLIGPARHGLTCPTFFFLRSFLGLSGDSPSRIL